MTSVFVRKKPLLEKNDYEIVKCLDDKTVSVKRIIKTYDGKLKNKFTKYNFNGVFDDNKNNTDLLEKRLEKQGHKVYSANNGKDALLRLGMDRNEIDVILLDIVMPEMNGFEVLMIDSVGFGLSSGPRGGWSAA